MKVSLIILLGFIVGTTGFLVPNSDFRTRTLDFFNDVREMMAAGTITRIVSVVNALQSEDAKFGPVGPAANMFRLAWSRELEQIAFEEGVGGKREGYAIFSWQGDLFQQIKALVEALPIDFLVGDTVSNAIKEIVGKALDALFIIIRILMLAYDYPRGFPLTAAQQEALNSTNALFAERTHIGCFNRLVYSTCVLKKVPGDRDYLFVKGIPCSKCPEDSRCEITKRQDGWYEEGDLCIPWQNEKPKNVAAARTSDDYDDEATTEDSSATYSLTTTIFIFAVIKILDIY